VFLTQNQQKKIFAGLKALFVPNMGPG